MFSALTVYAIAIAFVIWRITRPLEQRLERLERLMSSGTPDDKRIDAQRFLETLRELHLGRFPRSTEPLDRRDAAEELADIMATERPALKRVLTFSMWMSRNFIANVIGMTEGDLQEVRDHTAPERFWPAYDTTIEQWATHTVVFSGANYVRTMYEENLWHDWSPHVVWRHDFGEVGSQERWTLAIVIFNNTIRCWAEGGRFKGRYWSGEAEDEFQFITIPLNPTELEPFLRPDTEPPDPQYGYKSKPWDKQFTFSDESKGIGWNLHVLDKVASARR